jgi:hypothetical protein
MCIYIKDVLILIANFIIRLATFFLLKRCLFFNTKNEIEIVKKANTLYVFFQCSIFREKNVYNLRFSSTDNANLKFKYLFCGTSRRRRVALIHSSLFLEELFSFSVLTSNIDFESSSRYSKASLNIFIRKQFISDDQRDCKKTLLINSEQFFFLLLNL